MTYTISLLQSLVVAVGGPFVAGILLLVLMFVLIRLMTTKQMEEKELAHLRKCYGVATKQ